MNIVIRIIYPLFMWVGMMTYGLEAVKKRSIILILFNVLVLAALSQGYWISHLRDKSPKPIGDILSFGAGLLAVVSFLVYAAWKVFGALSNE